jgi:hypothetical protein
MIRNRCHTASRAVAVAVASSNVDQIRPELYFDACVFPTLIN